METTRRCTRGNTRPPPERPAPTNVTPFDIYDETSSEVDIYEAVRRMRRNGVGEHTHLRAEHLQTCIREA